MPLITNIPTDNGKSQSILNQRKKHPITEPDAHENTAILPFRLLPVSWASLKHRYTQAQLTKDRQGAFFT